MRIVCLLIRVEDLQEFFYLRKICRYYSSFARAADILLPAEALKVFFFLYKKCIYSSSCGRVAVILHPLKELHSSSYSGAAGILPMEEQHIYFFL